MSRSAHFPVIFVLDLIYCKREILFRVGWCSHCCFDERIDIVHQLLANPFIFRRLYYLFERLYYFEVNKYHIRCYTIKISLCRSEIHNLMIGKLLKHQIFTYGKLSRSEEIYRQKVVISKNKNFSFDFDRMLLIILF